jgi:hypothetical protein
MRVLVGTDIGSYVFNPATSVVTLAGLPGPLVPGQVTLIVNAASNTVIFNLADPTLGGVYGANYIDLNYNTTAMNATDPLQIFAEVYTPMFDIVTQLTRLIKILESNATVDQQNRQRVTVDAITAGSTNIGNVSLSAGAALIGSTGTSQTVNTPGGNPYTAAAANVQSITEGPVDQRWRIADAARTSFATGIRQNLITS